MGACERSYSNVEIIGGLNSFTVRSNSGVKMFSNEWTTRMMKDEGRDELG